MFDIQLPYVEVDPNSKQACPETAGKRILLIDGNPIARASMLKYLKAWNFDCAGATSGTEAKAMLLAMRQSRVTPDCILLDSSVQDTDCREMVAGIRALPGMAEVPLLVFTSVHQFEVSGELSQLHSTECLEKPVRPSRLKVKLSEHRNDLDAADDELRRNVAVAQKLAS